MPGTFVELWLCSNHTDKRHAVPYHGKRSQQQTTIQVLCDVDAVSIGKKSPTFRRITARSSSGSSSPSYRNESKSR